MKAKTINEVIRHLDDIIDWCWSNKSRMGYFAALYRKVTVQVKMGIEKGVFDDGERMERLDVIFANRYLEAFSQFQSSDNPTHSWKVYFDAAGMRRPIVLQHLLLGMSAHIDLDLGIAAAQTVAPDELPGLKGDFDRINKVLSSLIDEVQKQLAEVWPLLKVFDFAAGEFDELLARFGIEIARDHAWRVAEEVSALPEEERPASIRELDQRVLKMGRLILNPGFSLKTVLLIIRLGEMRSVRKIIDVLK